MKKLFSCFLIITGLVVASGSYAKASAFDSDQEAAQILPKLIFKGSHSNDIIKATFNSAGNLILSYSKNSELKLWDAANLQLLETHTVTGIKDIAWLAGTDKFIVLTQKEAIFYNKNFEPYGTIKNKNSSAFEYVTAFHHKDQVIITQKGIFTIYDSKGNEKGTETIQRPDATKVLISPDDQDLIFMSNNTLKLYLYNANNLDYQREIDSDYYGHTSTAVIIGDELWLLAKNGINKTQLATGITSFKSIKNWSQHNKNFNLIEADKNYFIYNKGDYYSNNRLMFAELDATNNYKIITENTTELINADSLVYNKMAKKLIALYNKDIFIYDFSSLYTAKPEPIKPEPAIKANIAAPVVITEPIRTPQPLIIEDTKPEPQIEKQVETPKEPLKPLDITIVASVTEGIAPLDVTFLLNSARPEMVATTYSNIANKEQLYQGIPLAIKHTFTQPGKHSAVFAFRTAEGKIVKDSVLIDVRKESFEDYKKRILGQ